MSAQILRPYQERAVHDVFAAWREHGPRVLVVMPTGSGKTSCFSWIAFALSVPVLIIVHRRELATQAANRLREFGVDFGYIMAGKKPRPAARVQIASVQTLVQRVRKGQVPPARLVVIDEAHLSTAASYNEVLEHYTHAKILGATATPWRLSGKPLRDAYDGLVVGATPRELREQGHLSPYVGFSYKAPDLSEVATVAGEYNEKQSAAAMRAPAIVVNIVEQWLAHAKHLTTIVFAVTVEHSKDLTAQFVAAGVRAEHVDGTMSIEQREGILGRVDAGHTQVLINVGIAVEGLDIPRVKCIVLARPTQSLARAIQMMGRGRRPWKGLTCRIHDHAFVIAQHGLPDAERDYTLTGKPEKPPALKQCKQCLAYDSGDPCSVCGHVPVPQIRGERQGPEELDDAEQVQFSSDDEPAPEIVVRGVDLTWDHPREIEGVFESAGSKDTKWGPVTIYIVVTKRYRYAVPGTYMLNQLWAKARPAIKPGDTVRIRYVGDQPNGRHVRKLFQLAVDRATDSRFSGKAGV